MNPNEQAFSPASRFAKLDRNNYAVWKIRIRMALTKTSCWPILPASTFLPDPLNNNTIAASATQIAKDAKTLAEIILSVEDDQLAFIDENQPAQCAWDNLKNEHEKQGIANKLTLKREFYALKHDPNEESVKDLIIKIISSRKALLAIGSKIEDDDIVCITLNSLADIDYFSPLITTIETMKEIPSISFIFERIEHEAKKHEQKNQINSSDSALSTTTPKKIYTEKQTALFNSRFCSHCKIKGHTIERCRSKSNLTTTDNNTANQSTDEFLFMASDGNSTVNSSEWIIDSGATLHLINNYSQLVNPTKLETPINIRIADKTFLPATHYGSTTIATETNKFILQKVYFVNGLDRNLLSVSELLSNSDVTIAFKAKTCCIKQGNITVLDIPISGKLFIIKNSNSNSKLALPAIQEITKPPKSISSQLWHNRLGHLNPKYLSTLVSNNLSSDLTGKLTKPLHCESCAISKSTRHTISTVISTA
jgi:hypothetical protein